MGKILNLLLGIVLVVAPIWLALTYADWGAAAVTFLQGAVVVCVVMVGLILLVAAISDLKG